MNGFAWTTHPLRSPFLNGFVMKTSVKSILVLVICLFPIAKTSASHIVGGDVTYTFLKHNASKSEATYEVTFTIYRDQKGIAYEPIATFGVYRQTLNGDWITETVIENVPLKESQPFSATNDPCSMQMTSDIRVEYGIYTFEITLPVIDYYYKIAYQKCCRNHTINNIKDAGTTGAVFDIKISAESQLMGNSSPRFTAPPPTYICVNEPLYYMHGAMDPESNALRYSFCVPYVAGGIVDYQPQCCDCQSPEVGFCPPPFDEIIYNTGYSYDNPLGGSSALTINSENGEITGTPAEIGSYVIGVCVEEMKDGRVLSSIRRDFQFTVVECVPALSASVISDTNYIQPINGIDRTIHEFNLCYNEGLFIENNSGDLMYIDDYSWTLYDSQNINIFNASGPSQRDLNIAELKSGKYTGSMILNANQACSDTAYFIVNIEKEIQPEFTYEYDPCYMSPIHFSPVDFENYEKIVSWNWNFGDGTSVDAMSGAYTYTLADEYQVTLTVIDEQLCSYSYEMRVDYDPITTMPELELIESTETICNGESILFDGELKYESGTYEYIIPTQDKLCDSILYRLILDLHPEPTVELLHKYICPEESILFNGKEIYEAGTYIENLEYNEAACDSIVRELKVEEAILPKAHLPTDTTITIRSDYTIPLDIKGEYSAILWSPQDLLDCSQCEQPTTILTDNQHFMAIITSIDGCNIEKGIHISVEENNNFYMANSISTTPGDESLYVQSRPEINYKYDMYIYDRYGSMIHECLDATCNDASQGWKPTNLNTGAFAYVVKFKDEFYQEILAGSITVIR